MITLAWLIAGLTSQILKIQLSTASLARKQNNYKLAESVLLSQIDNLIKPNIENGRVAPENLLSALSTLQSNKKAVSQLEVLRVEREGAKLLHSMAQQKESIDILSSSIVGFICADLKQEKKDKELLENCSQLCGKSLLTLVKWLQVDYKNLSSIVTQGGQPEGEDSVLAGNLQLLMETEARASGQGMGLVMEENSKLRERAREKTIVTFIWKIILKKVTIYIVSGFFCLFSDISIADSAIVNETDSLIGRLLNLSTVECPTLSKAWFTLAGWCYKWGRKSVDNAR